MVRYEDVCARPLPEAQQLWAWLGWALSPAAAAWVNASTHKVAPLLSGLAPLRPTNDQRTTHPLAIWGFCPPKEDAPTRTGAYGTARADPLKVAHAWQVRGMEFRF
jgi:hypothetical protein